MGNDVMTVDMKWRDALAERCIGLAFSPQERQVGWPSVMSPSQLAAMQRPYGSGDSKGRKLMYALRDALHEACHHQSIDCSADVRSVKVADATDFVPTSLTRDWPDAYTRDGVFYAYTRSARYEQQTFYSIAAADFAAWLTTQEMQASEHIAAWFKVCGVCMQMASATGAEGLVVLAAQDVRDIPSLVLYRKQFANLPQQERPQWHADHVALLAEWLRNEKAQSQVRGALAALAGRLGVSRQTLGELLQRHGFKSGGEVQEVVADLRSAVNGWGR